MLDKKERIRVAVAVECCGSVAAAARLTQHSRRTVRKYAKTSAPATQPRQQQPHIASRRAALVRLAKETRTKDGRTWPAHGSANALRTALIREGFPPISRRHVSREIKQVGLRSYVRPRTPTRRRIDVEKRRAFARKELRRNRHRRLVFTDESWLSCNEATGKRQVAENRSQVLPIERKSRWNLPCVMIWASIGYNYKGPLVFFPSKRTADEQRCYRLDGAGYVRRCLSVIVPDLVARNLTLVHDGARSHAAGSTTSYLQRKGVDFIDDFPPYSPDLNMIEPIWHVLAQRIGLRCPMTVDELIRDAKIEWEALPQSVINEFIDHFPSALKKCI